MGTYTRLGSYLLASELASDPLGSVHRAVVIAGNNFDRHVLVRTFSEQLFQAGMNTRLAEAGRVVPLPQAPTSRLNFCGALPAVTRLLRPRAQISP